MRMPLTIFTPTYQRAVRLPRLYASLQAQTVKSFEWIVIDDGGMDETPELVRAWAASETAFPIRFQKIAHGGKHRAINHAVEMAEGEAFFIVDSDDALYPDAVEHVLAWFAEIADDPQFAGVSGLGTFFDGTTNGGDGDGRVVDATNLEREEKHLLGDKAEVYKTSVHRKYPFPEIPGEDFLTEAVVWDAIAADGYKLRWYPVPIYYCEYLPDGLSRGRTNKMLENPRGYLEWFRVRKACHALTPSILEECLIWYAYFEGTPLKMEMDAEVRTEIQRRCKCMSEAMIKYVSEHGIRTIALYGIGKYGQALLRLLNRWGMQPAYLLDRKKIAQQGDIPVYSPDELLPQRADAVFVSLKNKDAALETTLAKTYPFVVFLMDFWRKLPSPQQD